MVSKLSRTLFYHFRPSSNTSWARASHWRRTRSWRTFLAGFSPTSTKAKLWKTSAFFPEKRFLCSNECKIEDFRVWRRIRQNSKVILFWLSILWQDLVHLKDMIYWKNRNLIFRCKFCIILLCKAVNKYLKCICSLMCLNCEHIWYA